MMKLILMLATTVYASADDCTDTGYICSGDPSGDQYSIMYCSYWTKPAMSYCSNGHCLTTKGSIIPACDAACKDPGHCVTCDNLISGTTCDGTKCVCSSLGNSLLSINVTKEEADKFNSRIRAARESVEVGSLSHRE
mmetsp:Transcript_27110/g.40927  ORF Transcript_27110/g.40927 Transcript_27110/m.40927 type:complete len:137 (-) Transcript_27110:307-717(-)